MEYDHVLEAVLKLIVIEYVLKTSRNTFPIPVKTAESMAI